MALTSKQQNQVVQLLGYGGKILQPGSVIYNKILNDRLSQLPPDTEEFVADWLTQVAAIEAQIKDAVTRLTAEKVGDVTPNRREIEDLRRERKRIARELSVHLDIPYIGSSNTVNVVV